MSLTNINLLKQATENGFIRVVEIAKEIDLGAKTRDGDLKSLKTVAKTNLVSAINEIKDAVDGFSAINDDATETTSSWSSHKTQAVINEKVAEVIDTIVGGAGENDDTLKELADKIAAQMLASEGFVSFKVEQSLSEEEKSRALKNLGLEEGNIIDDAKTELTTTWSSTKIAAELQAVRGAIPQPDAPITVDFVAKINEKFNEV